MLMEPWIFSEIATGKRETQRKLTNYLFGIMSILLGLISFFSPIATIFIIVTVIAIRIFIRGLKVIIDARRSRRKYEGLAWLFGILLMTLWPGYLCGGKHDDYSLLSYLSYS